MNDLHLMVPIKMICSKQQIITIIIIIIIIIMKQVNSFFLADKNTCVILCVS